MEAEKGKTYKYLREKREVSEKAKENLKQFNRIKKSILDSLKDGEMTIKQLSDKLQMPENEMVFYLMSLVKFGFVQTGTIDDMDEYYSYKLKSDGRN